MHNIFTFNAYPRKGNHSDLTPCKANVLYHVATGVRIYLSSLIIGSIVHFLLSPGFPSNPCPFGTLMSTITMSYQIPISAIEKPKYHALRETWHR